MSETDSDDIEEGPNFEESDGEDEELQQSVLSQQTIQSQGSMYRSKMA